MVSEHLSCYKIRRIICVRISSFYNYIYPDIALTKHTYKCILHHLFFHGINLGGIKPPNTQLTFSQLIDKSKSTLGINY
jgi:hypothetical protein